MDEWECMLSEIFDRVLRCLDTDDVKQSRLVCTTWREKVDSLISSMALKRALHVHKMVSSFQGQMAHMGVEFGLALASGLTEVILSFASESDFAPGLLRPLRELKRLQALTLDNRGAVQPTILGLEALQGPSITTLRMKGCLLCAACGLGRVTQLLSIELYHCILMLGMGHSLPAELRGMRRLHTLVCEGCSSLSGAPLAGLPALAMLRVCRLNRLTYVCDETCRDLALLPKVEELQLACAHKTGCAERRCITQAGVASLCQMTQLTHLDLSRHETVSDDSIELIANCLSNLSHLDIRAHGLLQPNQRALMCTDEGIAALRKLQRLRSLLISNAQVLQSGCAAIASLPELQRLELSQCQSLTDTAACELMRLTALKELCLSNSSRVTDIALSTLVNAMPRLVLLDLSGCHLHVSDISLYAIAGLRKLQTLSLRDCERITDRGIWALCKGAAASSLLHLTVNACDRLTDAAALHMAASLQHLHTLSLEHCRHFTSRGIGALQGLRALQTLRAGGMADSAVAAARGLRPKVTVNTFENRRIWWMPALPASLAVA